MFRKQNISSSGGKRNVSAYFLRLPRLEPKTRVPQKPRNPRDYSTQAANGFSTLWPETAEITQGTGRGLLTPYNCHRRTGFNLSLASGDLYLLGLVIRILMAASLLRATSEQLPWYRNKAGTCYEKATKYMKLDIYWQAPIEGIPQNSSALLDYKAHVKLNALCGSK